jgi:hypothetical protein
LCLTTASPSSLDTGQILVKYWSNTGQNLLRVATNAPSSIKTSQILVKYWSNTGQVPVKRWSNAGGVCVM